VDLVVGADDQVTRAVRVEHERVAWMHDGHAAFTGRRARKQRGGRLRVTGQVVQQRNRDARVLDNGLGQRGASRFLGDEHEVDVVQTETARRFRRKRSGQPHLDDARPASMRLVAAPFERGPDGGRRTDVVEQFAER
jgi:hypothetical protein